MPSLVVDSSVAIKWFAPEPYSAQAHEMLADYRAGTLDFLAPDLFYAEVGNIVWRKQRFEGLPTADALDIINTIQLIRFTLTSNIALLDEAYRIAVAYERTVYDALYVALSNHESCPFVTADEKLVRALQSTFPLIVWIGDWISH